jgi:hypothetical protein
MLAVRNDKTVEKKPVQNMAAVYATLKKAFIGWAYYSLADLTHFGQGPILKVKQLSGHDFQHYQKLWSELMGNGEYLFPKLPVNAVTLVVDATCLDPASVVKALPADDVDYPILAWNRNVEGQTDIVTLGNGYHCQQVVENLLLQQEQVALKTLENKIKRVKEKQPMIRAELVAQRKLLPDDMLKKGLWLADVYDKGKRQYITNN